MGNTQFYQQLQQDSTKITWKDVLSECRDKHTHKELEYAFLAGTTLDGATEQNMLHKWSKPWIFYPLLKGGLALIALIYGIYFALSVTQGFTSRSFLVMLTIIPPLIIPIILMIFIWELNIPRNISIYELFGYFIVGGLLSFAFNAIMFNVVEDGPASWAAFREEPAKLAASLLLIYIFSRKKKVYGLTGLVIGAAVGAGFGGFESVSYAMMAGEEGVAGTIFNQLLRGIYALGGHTVFCAPYVGALALNMTGSKLSADCFINKDFLVMFASSSAMHYLWNSQLEGLGVWKNIAIIVLLWAELLYIARKCLYQAVSIGQGRQVRTGSRAVAVSGRIVVECLNGPVCGAVWQSEGAEELTIGRDSRMKICIPGRAPGVSRTHCSIQRVGAGWTIRDLSSTYGTFVGGVRLTPGRDYTLRSGEVIYLAGKEYAFRVTIR